MWRAGLRRGKIRDTMTQYLAERPQFAERLRRLSRALDAIGWKQMSMEGVRQPFDYAPRKPERSRG
jgi:hypothetical protein